MVTAAAISLELKGSASITGTAGLLQRPLTLPLGQGTWDEMKLALSFGTGNNQVNNWWADQRVLAAGANDDLDFAGAGAPNGASGDALAFTAIKLLLIAIDDPDGTKRLRVGPQGLAAAFQGPWGGLTATDYTEIRTWSPIINAPFSGFPVVGGTTDKLRVNNPSAVSVTYRILAAGVQ